MNLSKKEGTAEMAKKKKKVSKLVRHIPSINRCFQFFFVALLSLIFGFGCSGGGGGTTGGGTPTTNFLTSPVTFTVSGLNYSYDSEATFLETNQ